MSHPRSQQVNIVVGTTPTEVLGNNPFRTAIHISGDGGHVITYRWGSAPVSGSGVVFSANSTPTTYYRDEMGELITQQLWAVGATAGATANVIEIFE